MRCIRQTAEFCLGAVPPTYSDSMYASPQDEMTHRHYAIWLGSLYKNLLLLTFCFLALGLALAPQTLLANVENFEKMVPGFVENRTKFSRGFTGRVTLAETVESLDPNHPLFDLEKRQYTWISYNFGSNPHNYCDRRPFLNVTTLPSLLRVMEFRASTQFLIRASVLCCLLFRFFLSLCSGSYMHHLSGSKALVKVGWYLLPILDLAWMSFATIVLCLQMDQDKKIKHWMYWHISAFGGAFLLYAIVYTVMYAWTFRNRTITILQLCSILLFGACIPNVVIAYLPILAEWGKPCYVDVPYEDALMEYAAILAVLTFVSTQFWELKSFEGMITLMEMEYQCYFVQRPDYSPYYTSDRDRRSSLNPSEASSSEASTPSDADSAQGEKTLSTVS